MLKASHAKMQIRNQTMRFVLVLATIECSLLIRRSLNAGGGPVEVPMSRSGTVLLNSTLLSLPSAGRHVKNQMFRHWEFRLGRSRCDFE